MGRLDMPAYGRDSKALRQNLIFARAYMASLFSRHGEEAFTYEKYV